MDKEETYITEKVDRLMQEVIGIDTNLAIDSEEAKTILENILKTYNIPTLKFLDRYVYYLRLKTMHTWDWHYDMETIVKDAETLETKDKNGSKNEYGQKYTIYLKSDQLNKKFIYSEKYTGEYITGKNFNDSIFSEATYDGIFNNEFSLALTDVYIDTYFDFLFKYRKDIQKQFKDSLKQSSSQVRKLTRKPNNKQD